MDIGEAARAREDQEDQYRARTEDPRRARGDRRADARQVNLHWMPTISGDTQMVLPIDEVMYQAQKCAR